MFPDALLDRFAAPIRALPDRKRALTWRLIRIVLALLAGAGTAFAHPPFGVPLLVPPAAPRNCTMRPWLRKSME